MKQLLNLRLTQNISLNATNRLLKFHAPELPPMQPGQFVEIRIDNAPNTFLRRPISINWVDEEKNELWLLIQAIGEGTQKLCSLSVGEEVSMILPLGNSFSIPTEGDTVALIGGGVGTAPLLYFGKRLNDIGIRPSFILGGKTKDAILQTDIFAQLGTLYITTEDGSAGEKGFVTHHSILRQQSFDKIYTCGPKPMMKAVVDLANQQDIWCEVSLENSMACGFGVCLCCVEQTKQGNKCVCTEGPIINKTELTW